MSNKAHTATLNRICHRYGFSSNPDGPHDISAEDFIIEVETSASIPEAVQRLKSNNQPVYIAITNKEGIKFATEMVKDTPIGVMDPQGNVVRAARNHVFDEVLEAPE